MTPDLAEKLRLWRQEHGATGGPVAVPTGTNEPPPSPSLIDRLNPPGTPLRTATDIGGRLLGEGIQTGLGNVERIAGPPLGLLSKGVAAAAVPLSNILGTSKQDIREGNPVGTTLLSTLGDIGMALPVGAPVGSLAGTAGRGVATQASLAASKAAPVARELATSEVGAIGKVPKKPITKPAASEGMAAAAKAAQATEGLAAQERSANEFMRMIKPDRARKPRSMSRTQAEREFTARMKATSPKAPVEAKAVSESGGQIAESAAAPSTGVKAAAESGIAPGIAPPPGSAVPPAKPPIEPPVTTGAVPPGEPFAANIRLSKYPEDLRSTVKEWADANPDAVQAARRGTRSDAQVLEDAKNLVDEVGGDFARLQRRWKAGEAWNAEEITAIRGTLRSKTQTVVDAAKVAADADSSANQMRLLSALEEQARVQEIVHGITAESGRALRAFRQQAFDAVQSNDTAKMEELLKRLGGRAKTAEVAKALRDLDMNNPTAVNDFIRTILKPKAWDYITEIYYNSILSGPKTHIINGLSNMITTALSPIERGTSAVVERGLAPLQSRQVERFFSEVPADTLGAIQGIQEGLQNAAYTLKNGFSPAQASKWEFRPRAFQGTIGRVINTPSTALEAADALNRSINYRAAFNATVIRQAKKEGWTGQELLNRIADLKASPSVGILKEADHTAEYRLFRQEPGEVMAKFMALRDSYPAFRFVVPFIRTPGNLLKFGLERTPAGLFNPKLWRNIASKNPEASDQIGRIFLGSSVAAFFAWQIANGNLDITGAAPSSAAERDRFYREGKQPFAVRVGDTWIQFQRIEPLNQALSQVAAVAEAIRDKDSTVEEKASHAVLTIGENLVSQTYASSIADLINALSQPERYGGQYLTRQLTGLVPASSALRTGAQLADTTVRKPGNLGESIKVGIPGASRNVPPSLTAFGEEVKRQSPPISPILFSQAKESPVDTELARLGIEVGFIGDSIEGIKLTREQRQRYQEVAGQLVKIALDSLVQSPQYKATTDAEKEKGLRHVIDSARDKARAQIKQQFGLRKGMTPQNQPARVATSAPTAPPQPTTESRLEQWRREHATPVPAGAR